MPALLNDRQSCTLRTVCNTFVPAIRKPDDPTGFWRRAASDLGVDREISQGLAGQAGEVSAAVLGLLDYLSANGFERLDQSRREKYLSEVYQKRPNLAPWLSALEKQTVQLAYGLPASASPDANLVTYGSPNGQNPMWETLGYPGPVSVPHNNPKTIRLTTPHGDRFMLDADVCVVGSGAGGAVTAAKLAAQGRRVVVLEAGGYYNSADFHQLELWGYRHLWYRGGATPTANGTVLLLAGSTLGGGTEINWMNCVRTPDVVRSDWARNFGIAGADGPEFDRHLDAVERRISSNSQTAVYNAQNLRMREGCEKLGYKSRQTHVNWRPDRFNPLMAGYTGFGDQTGGKQTARRTYLQDAFDHGARIVANCSVNTIAVENGRARGVDATYSGGGRTTNVRVNAPIVIVAGGSLESPALLLRSGIGGPAVGKNLHLQPGGAIYGVYGERQKGWWGSPMTANCEQFTNIEGEYGFYMEIPAFGPGFVASVIPWKNGLQHKQMMTKVPFISTFIWFLRDRGCGRVSIDSKGQSIATYQLDDELDQRNFRRAAAEAMRIHHAAGAKEIFVSLAHDQMTWKRPGRLNDFIASVMKQPLTDGRQPMISAHQLSTCRMGVNRSDSVANPDGELHDTRGVWVADASACPTALGANPMITIMALASRTADRIAAGSTASPKVAARPGRTDTSMGVGIDALMAIPAGMMMTLLRLRLLAGLMQALAKPERHNDASTSRSQTSIR
jgi:choline dehydrogenase-like flavoprotein